MRKFPELFLYIFFSAIIPQAVLSQEAAAPDSVRINAVKIFLDCRDCDMNYTRQEIPYINYVRDVKEAEVYILVTEQSAGSGGEHFTFTFQGQGKFQGLDDTLTYTTSPDQTSTIIREKRTNMLKMGLMRYVAKTPLFNEIDISHTGNLEEQEVIDRWNNWVFSISTEPQFESEETNKELFLRNSLNINKITPEIKLEVEMDHFYRREKFVEDAGTEDESVNTYTTSDLRIQNLFVKSLSEHWSAGLRWDIGSSTRENYNLATNILPSVEYDIFPYSEATHRQLRILYGAGFQGNNYIDTTVFNKAKENLFLQTLNIAFEVRKKWGSIGILLTGSNYFHDFSKNRIELNSSLSIRIFKGLSVQIQGGIAHINDQLNLKKGGITEAERLLRLRELATRYRIDGGVELTYTFGSIYNNVVNPRFSSSRFRF
ncbi:MAG: hypothetical protein JXR67_07580 [Bacteroidales bacterium]|nr:hypothetical protein [Bacteroidales bacterium]